MAVRTINNRYRVLKTLGKGGMGTVYLVEDLLHSGRRLALKTMSRKRISEEFIGHFKHEFKLLTGLRHPNLTEVFDFGVIKGEENYFYTLEYVEGKNLFEFSAKLDFDALYEVLVNIARALEYIHSRGCIHYDVKPENILVRETDGASTGEKAAGRLRVKLLDFGLAAERSVGTGLKVRGTVHYVAPEVIKGQTVDGRADLYSLGISLYRVVTRKVPFDGDTSISVLRQHIEKVPEPPASTNRDVPRPLEIIIMKLMAKEPSDRFSRASDIIRAVNELAGKNFAMETEETRRSYVLTGRFVGRDKEIGLLSELHGQIISGRDSADAVKHLVLVTGEPGIGKTRLMREFGYHVQLNRVSFIPVAYDVWGNAPYEPIRVALRQILASGLIASERGRRVVEKHGRELVKLLPELGEDWGLSPSALLESRDERIRLMMSAVGFILDVSRLSPLVIFFDDLHLADEATFDLVDHLARNAGIESGGPDVGAGQGKCLSRYQPGGQGQSPVRTDSPPWLSAREDIGIGSKEPWERVAPKLLVCCTSTDGVEIDRKRQERLNQLSKRKYVLKIPLSHLGKERVVGLATSMLGSESLPAGLEPALVDWAGGNPLFVEEAMKTLMERDVLAFDVRGWVMRAESLRDLDIAPGIESIVRARLARLDDASLRLVEAVAVLGKPTSVQMLSALVSSTEEEIFAVAHRLSAMRIFQKQRSGTRFEYSIPAKAVRAVVLSRMSDDARREMHRRIAEFLESSRVGQEGVEELAFHFAECADAERAAKYSVEAARNAAGLFAHHEAARFYETALAFLGREDGERRRQVLEEVADVQEKTGQFAKALENLQRVLSEGEDSLDEESRARLLRKIGDVRAETGDFDAASRAYAEAEELSLHARAVGEIPLILCGMAGVAVRKGRLEKAVRLARGAVLALRRQGEDVETSRVFSSYVALLGLKGQVSEALNEARRAVAVRKKRGDLPGVAEMLGLVGHLLVERGKFGKSLQYLRRSLRTHRELGNLIGIAQVLNDMGLACQYLRDYEAASLHYEEAFETDERIGNAAGGAAVLCNLGTIAKMNGRPREALERFSRAINAFEEIGQTVMLGSMLANRAYAHLDLNDYDRALEDAKRARDVALEVGAATDMALALRTIATVYAQGGCYDKAEEMARECLKVSQGAKNIAQVGLAHAILGFVELCRNRLKKAERHCRRAIEIFQKIGVESYVVQPMRYLAQTLLERGDIGGAMVFWREAFRVAKKYDMWGNVGSLALVRGRIEHIKGPGHYDAALKCCQSALKTAERTGNLELVWQAYFLMAQVFRGQGRAPEAGLHYQKALDVVNEVASRFPEEVRAEYLSNRWRRQILGEMKALPSQ